MQQSKMLLNFIKVLLTVSALFFSGIFFAEAATYYVSNTGSDSNSGLAPGLSWQTIAKVNTYAASPGFLPGDFILFKRGDTWREMLVASSSGSAGNVITYGAYGSGVKPIITASDVSTNWISLGAAELPGGVFGSGFESGTTTDFNSISVSGTNTLAITTTRPHQGNYSLEGTFSGVTTDRNLRVNKTIATSSDVYTRAYFYFDPTFDISATSTRLDILLLRQDTSVTRARVSLLKHTDGSFYLQGTILTPSTNIFYAGVPGEIVRGQWYAIELRFKGGDASTGGAQLWLDNVSLGSNYTFNTSGLTIARVEVGTHSSSLTSPTAGAKLYIDDVKIATTSVGLFIPEGDSETYKRSGFVTNVRQVFADGAALAPVSSFGALASDTFYNDVVAGAVYLKLASNANPNSRVIETSRRQAAASVVARNYLAFDNLSFRANNTVSFGALSITSGNNIIITECEFLNNYGSGLEFANSSSNNTVSSSTFAANDRDFGGSVRIETDSNDNIVQYNTMTGIIDGIRAGNGVNIRGNLASSSRNIVRYNLIHDMRDSGIYVNTNSNYNEIYGNVIYAIDDALAGTQGGNGIHIGNLTSTSTFAHSNYIHNNVIYDVATHGISLREGSYQNLVYNNTVYNVGVNRGAISGNEASGSGINLHSTSQTIATGPKNNRVFNNIVSTCATRCLNVDNYAVAAGGNVVDYNLYENGSSTLVRWDATNYTDFALYVATTNQDNNSLQSMPQFTDATGADFTLLSNSPAINAGTSSLGNAYKLAFSDNTNIPNNPNLADQDMYGSNWEMGAYAYTNIDVTSPVISAVSVVLITSTTATIEWATNEVADSVIEYGTTTSYGATTTLNVVLEIGHSEVLSNLLPNTTYHFRVRSRDNSNNITYSGDTVFTTLSANQSVVTSSNSSGGGKKSNTMNATSSVELMAALQARIVELQAILSSLLTTNKNLPARFNFKRNLGVGMIGPDVLALQKYLNRRGYVVSDTGIGAVGLETDFYGEKTASAVASYQWEHEIKPAFGYFGTLTRTHVLYWQGVY